MREEKSNLEREKNSMPQQGEKNVTVDSEAAKVADYGNREEDSTLKKEDHSRGGEGGDETIGNP